MNRYDPTSPRSTAVSLLCAILVSATCLTGALAPAQAVAPAAVTAQAA